MNWLKIAIEQAVNNGVSPQTIIYFLLLPLVASLVAAARHLVGFRGFGILIPTAIALAFSVIGVVPGILAFLAILLTAYIAHFLLKFLKIHYLPRRAMLLWLTSLVLLGLIFISPALNIKELTTVSIFPILVLILLAEEFMAVQLAKSSKEASRLIIETMFISLMGYFIFDWEWLQRFVLDNPFWAILTPLVINLIIGRFAGLRLLEYYRFRKLLK